MRRTILVVAAVLAAPFALVAVSTSPAGAASPTINVSSTTGLLDGQLVSVTGSGFSPGQIAVVVECSNAAGQPTVNLDGFPVRVSCDSPLNGSGYPFNDSALSSAMANGTVDTSFVVHTGVIGPPTLGIDSAGHSSAADAALYPCPPTTAQQAAGSSCELTLGDSDGNSASVPISFGTPISTTPSIRASPSGGLASEEQVTVNGTGFTPDSPWLAMECNLTPGEPIGAQEAPNLPVSCDQATSAPSLSGTLGGSSPPSSYETDPSGSMNTVLTVAEGNIGGDQQSSAYPCPPSAANVAAEGSCAVLVEDGAGEEATFDIAITGPVPVAAIRVSPSTGLAAGTVVQITGESFASNQLAGVLECNGAAGQPTVSFEGVQVPVSCSVPQLTQTTSTGSLSSTFKIVVGVTGPPTEGTDSAGSAAGTDAAAYPCPPTPAQQAVGVTCDITAGDLEGDETQFPISFAASSCSGATGNVAFVCVLYEDLLDRAADTGGLSSWEASLAAGTDRSQVAYDIATSPEYRADLVESYYEAFLGRAADQAGLSFWVGEMNGGASDQSVIQGLVGSSEFYSDTGNTPDSFVTELYEVLLERSPGAGEVNYWESQLAGGTSRATVVGGIVSSTEYRTDFVESQYTELLQRSADPSGLSFWVAQLAGGTPYESVTSGIAGSPEFYSDATDT